MRAAAEFALTFGVVASAFEAPTRGRKHELFDQNEVVAQPGLIS
jgi:hypothetical protein